MGGLSSQHGQSHSESDESLINFHSSLPSVRSMQICHHRVPRAATFSQGGEAGKSSRGGPSTRTTALPGGGTPNPYVCITIRSLEEGLRALVVGEKRVYLTKRVRAGVADHEVTAVRTQHTHIMLPLAVHCPLLLGEPSVTRLAYAQPERLVGVGLFEKRLWARSSTQPALPRYASHAPARVAWLSATMMLPGLAPALSSDARLQSSKVAQHPPRAKPSLHARRSNTLFENGLRRAVPRQSYKARDKTPPYQPQQRPARSSHGDGGSERRVHTLELSSSMPEGRPCTKGAIHKARVVSVRSPKLDQNKQGV